MKSILNSDPNLKIYLNLDKIVYNVGDLITGSVYIRVTQDCKYRTLKLSITITQKIFWTQNNGQVTSDWKHKLQTYREQFFLALFDTGIKTGDYVIPFSILLPANTPATLQQIQDNNYIKAMIRAYLPAYSTKITMQAFDYKMNLRQPLRSQQPLISNKMYIQLKSQCPCCCCFDNQQSGFSQFQIDKNIVNRNESLIIKGYIDNNGKIPIQNYKVVLQQKWIFQSETQNFRSFQKEIQILHSFKDKISVGQRKWFNETLKIPSKIGHTAIGNIISRQYYITLVIELGFCSKISYNKKHIILTNQNGYEQQKIAKLINSLNFNPSIIKSTVNFHNLKPYIYNPSPYILDLNQKLATFNLMNQMNSNIYQTSPLLQKHY